MLTALRDRISGWIASAILIFVSIPFALWGIQTYFSGGAPQTAAVVNGSEIPVATFNAELQEQKRQLTQSLGGKLPTELWDETAMKERVVEGMIQRELLEQATRDAGFHVSDAQLVARLGAIPAFQTGGRFDPARYAQVLSAQRRPQAQFEEGLRQDLQLNQFVEGIGDTAFLSHNAAAQRDQLAHQRRSFRYARYPLEIEPLLAQISDDAVAEQYRSAQQRYQSPERVKLAYVELSEQGIIASIVVDDQTLKNLYDSGEADGLDNPERRLAQHILLRYPENATAEQKSAVRSEAEKLIERIRAGEDFGKLAAEHSDDALSAGKQGELGEVRHGDLAPATDTALFALAEGAVSSPLQLESGVEILRAAKIIPATRKPFEEVRESLAREYRQREAEARHAELSERLITTSYEQSDNLAAAADSLGVEIHTTDWFTREDGAGIAADPKVRAAAFSEEVLRQSKNSELIELADGRSVVVRTAEHEPPKPRPLNEVRNDIRRELATEKAFKAVREKSEKALFDLRAGMTLEAVAKRDGVQVLTADAVTRTDSKLPTRLVEQVFSMSRPAHGKPAPILVQMPDGGQAAVELTTIDEPASANTKAAAAEEARHYGEREFNAVYKALRDQADVEILPQNL